MKVLIADDDPVTRLWLTSRSSTGDIVEALNAAADDLVGKPFESEEFQVRLRAAIAAPISYNDNELNIIASIGIASLTQHTLDSSDWIAQADHALYRAKQGGRNRVAIAVDESAVDQIVSDLVVSEKKRDRV